MKIIIKNQKASDNQKKYSQKKRFTNIILYIVYAKIGNLKMEKMRTDTMFNLARNLIFAFFLP